MRPGDFVALLESTDAATRCWNWTKGKDSSGYGHTGLGKAHRLSYEAFVGPIPDGMMVLHKCDNRACINPLHLFLGTNQDNMDDMVQKQRSHKPNGEKNGRSRLTAAEVLAIRTSPVSATIIAAEFGVTPNMIYNIRARRAWKHLP